MLCACFFETTYSTTYKIGGDYNYPPYSYIDEQGKAAGHDVEIIQEISMIVGFQPEYHFAHWDTTLNNLKQGEIDIISGIVYSEERDKIYDFSTPLQTMYYSIFSNKESGIQDVEDLYGKDVVVLKGDIVNNKFLKPMGLFNHVSYANSLPDALMLVEWGQYDYVLAPYPLGMKIIKERHCHNIYVSSTPILPSVYCLAVKEGNHELLAKLNQAIDQLRVTGRLSEINNKWIEYNKAEDRFRQILTYSLIGVVALLLITLLMLIWSRSLKRQVKRKTEQILSTEKKYKNIFHSANDAIFILQMNGHIVDSNYQACTLYGYKPEEIKGMKLIDFITPAYHDWFQDFLKRIKTDENLYGESIDKKSNGELFHTDYKGKLISYNDEQHLMIIVRDITAYVDSKKKLQEAKEMAESASTLKSMFYSSISHDIRTPLNAIMGYSYLLKQTRNESTQTEYIEMLTHCSDALMGIINNVLDLAKIEAGKFELDISEFSLQEMLDNLHSIVQYDIWENNLEIEYVVDKNLPKEFIGDSLRIKQVLVNLISNAVKNTSEGYIKVEVELQEKSEMKYYLKFSVTDTGLGIKKGDLDKIFRSFEQIKSSGITGGVGLGLTICKQLIDIMQGELGVNSQEGEGSMFYFSIPLIATASKKEMKFKGDYCTLPAEHSLAGKNVLVVDDNRFNKKIIHEILKQKRVKVHLATGHQQTLESLQKNDIDLILMDLKMPEYDGFELTRFLKSESQYQDIPVIAVSAFNQVREKEKCLAFGMSDYISKPIGPDELFSKLLMYTEGNEIHHTRDEFNKSSEVSSNIISTDDILRNLRGNQNLYKKFLKRYLSVYQDLPANIEEEFSTKKYKRIERIAHDLKNAFGTIGAFAYIEKARKIENLVAMNKIDEADKIIPSFVAELRLLNREVERILFGDD